MKTLPTSTEELLTAIARHEHRRVKVAVTDLDGVLRGKYLHLDKLRSALDGGFGFCSVVFGWDAADACYDNATYTGWHTGYPDAVAQLDLRTYREIPWEDNTPFLLGDFADAAGEPLPICPRRTLRRVIGRAADLGYDARFGLEFEWFNFAETPATLAEKRYVAPTPLTPGMFGYSVLRASLHQTYFRDIMELLADFRVPVEGLHTETGPGVYEAAILYSDALEAADRGVLFKTAVKELAYRHGIVASFMAKWNAQLPGCSGHMHQSLWHDGANVFDDATAADRMSPTFRHYLAGQLALLPELLVLMAPTVNSYKRLVEGMWAPTTATWGVDNRTVALRVIPGGPKSTRLETRVSGSDMNAYLGIAAALGAGLWGIEHKLPLDTAAVVGNGYAAKAPRLPRDLDEATDRFEGSAAARALFGDAFVDHFAQSRRWEWRQFHAAVTDWELRRYLEII